MNLIVQLDSHQSISMYEQLYQYVKRNIIDGNFFPGEKLPSTRLLAQNLGVSRNTVERAYEQLAAEGYIEAKPCSGYRICNIEGLFSYQKAEKQQPYIVPPKESVGYLCDFTCGGIDEDSFPMEIYRRISRSVLNEQERFLSGGHPCGEQGLREEIVSYLGGARGVVCSPQQVIIGAGNDYLLMLLQRILDRRNVIAMEYPTYRSAYHALEDANNRIVWVRADRDGIDMKQLQCTDANLVYVMPSHQFPMGTVMPLSRRMALLSWAYEKEGRYIIEDDYDSELRYKGKPIPALCGSDEGQRVIYIGTFSLSIAPSIRVSYMVLPYHLMECYINHCGMFSNTVARLQQETIRVFMQEGHFERHLNRMRKRYKEKRDLLLSELGYSEKNPEILGADAGTHLLLQLPEGITEEQVQDMAGHRGVKVSGIKQYCTEIGTRKEQTLGDFKETLILSYGHLTKEQLKTGAEAIRKIIK